MFHRAWSVPLLVLAMSAGAAATASPQALALASRGPRFIAAWTVPGKTLDASNAAVFRRRVSLELTNVTADEALKEITRQADLEISYSKALLPSSRAVSLHVREITVAAALTEVLLDAGVDVAVARGGHMALVRRLAPTPAAEPQAADSGAVGGRVTDKASGNPVSGATVTVEGTTLSAATDADGHYTIHDVPKGTHRLQARYIGYAVLAMTVIVGEGEETTADFALTRSIQKLDELVTVSPGGIQAELKAVPSPITVITATDIEAQRPQTINDIFRQLVPSAVGFELPTQPTATGLSVRGASSIGASSAVKIFIDGVEVAARSTTPVDPSSIDRIEVIRGPQAATLYGSDAAAGVLQIFTKRGESGLDRPEVELGSQAGIVQTPYDGFGGVLRQRYHGSIRGSGPEVTYSFGGTYTHLDDWLPGGAQTRQSIPSAFGSIGYAAGMVTADLSARYLRSNLPLESNPQLAQTGFASFSRPQFLEQDWLNETYGARIGVTPRNWWRNQLTLGVDRASASTRQTQPRLTTEADTLFTVGATLDRKVSVQWNSRVTGPVSADVTGSLIGGIDYYRADQQAETIVGALNTTGTIQTAPEAFTNFSTGTVTNTGYFLQAEAGWREQIFLTAALRADDNSNFGQDLNTPLQPRVGLAVVQQVGQTTVKVRAAYGRAIRAPGLGLATGTVGPFGTQLANPQLEPERQRGWDGGLDLIFGTRGSLSVSGYDQVADNLIVNVTVAVDPVFTTQNRNLGRVTNRGIEIEGSLNLSPMELKAQYAYTDSRIRDLGPDGQVPGLEVDGRPLEVPTHTAGVAMSAKPWPGTAVSAGVTYVGGFRSLDFLRLARCFGGTGPCPDPPTLGNFVSEYPGFTKVNIALTQAITRELDGLLSIDNATNNDAFEGGNVLAVTGRTTMVGLRARF